MPIFCIILVKAFLLLIMGFGLRFSLFHLCKSAILVLAIHLMTCDVFARPISLSLEYRGIRSIHSVKPAVLHVGISFLSSPKLDSSMSDDMLCALLPSNKRLTSLSRYWPMSSPNLRVLSLPGSRFFDVAVLHLAAVSNIFGKRIFTVV